MADSLQSFFAKKDKKGKKKKQILTTEELAKKMEQEVQGANGDAGYDSQNEAPKPIPLTLPASIIKDDEEWNDFDEDRDADISDLKIQNLNLVERERLEEEEQETLQKAVEEAKSTMKWNINSNRDDESSDEEEPATPAPAPAAPVVAEEPKPTKYVPPALRNAPAAGPTLDRVSIKNTKRNQKIDVSSPDQFPSLGDAVSTGPANAWSARSQKTVPDGGLFTSVKKGARTNQDSDAPTTLKTSNQFAGLRTSKN